MVENILLEFGGLSSNCLSTSLLHEILATRLFRNFGGRISRDFAKMLYLKSLKFRDFTDVTSLIISLTLKLGKTTLLKKHQH